MSVWHNNDGLLVKLGVAEADLTKAGEPTNYGQHRVYRAVIDWDDLNAFGTFTLLSDTSAVPNGARIEAADLYVEDAFTSGGAATLDLGLYDQDRVTAIDADGIDAAIAVGALTAGATIACDGALIDTTLSNTGVLSATVGVANFTAGRGILTVKWYIPDAA